MLKKLLNLTLVAVTLLPLVPSAANAERYRWDDGVWRTNSVFVKTHTNRKYRPYFRHGHWYGYDNSNHRWNRYKKMHRVSNGYWFY